MFDDTLTEKVKQTVGRFDALLAQIVAGDGASASQDLSKLESGDKPVGVGQSGIVAQHVIARPKKSRARKGAPPEAISEAIPTAAPPRAKVSRRKDAKEQAIVRMNTNDKSPAPTPSASGGADEGLLERVNQFAPALVSEITMNHRRYEDLRRARARLHLQALAVCRGLSDGDKTVAAKLLAKPTPDAAAWLAPYLAAMTPLDEAIERQQNVLTKLGRKLPVADWAAGILGISHRQLAMIVGECGIGPGEFRTPSALWKRMGLAVIEGERQRRVVGDAALVHGYVPRRRALMWNIGETILKAQIRNPRGPDNKPTGDRFAIGQYGQIYIDRRALEATKDERDCVIHNRSKRYIEKRLLRELWKAWRAAIPR